MYRFSIITAFRNRDLERVRNSLDSLASQINQNFELIFVDYGSDEEVRTTVRPIVESYPFVTYIYNETRGMFWNRSHALNTGIRRAKGEITVLWDIDLMVEPAFLQKLEEQIDYRNTFTTHRCFYLPEGAKQKDYKQGSVLAKSKHDYVGLCTVDTDILQQIEGFDEYFQVWGAEDDDLYTRLEDSGLLRIMVNATDIPVYHQWHPTQAPALPDMWYLKMVEHLFNKRKMKRKGFGEILTKSNRPALSSFLNKTYPNFQEIQLAENKTFYYNYLIKTFLDDTKFNGYYIEHKFPQLVFSNTGQRLLMVFNNVMKARELNFRLINRRQEERQELKGNVYSFLKYFIGKNRDKIKDYYLDWREDGFLLALTT
ncbi:glycosyltransferase family 2 protein [Phaeodactylibacter luteus]|uniref:Glycosyltransferase n=1 Tax=Phaeodactylibacter luteus TaxID=1564516 RepID=A0A5C6RP93_9BACT|nr:glycosyltransferase [Phaeodactylibacter luteus]TXB63794.1 glycosyltransferase [Phaeodactylibacter luteus]